MTIARVTVASTTAGVREASRALDAFAAAHRLPPDIVADLQVAMDEVLSNIVTHGCRGASTSEIRVSLRVEAETVIMEVEDACPPFNPLSVPPPDRTTPLGERVLGGLGVHFIRTVMSDVEYAFVANHNRLTLRKKLDSGVARGPA